MAKVAVGKTVGLRATSGKRTLSFGLVSVGVSMGPAIDASARISGKYADPETLAPVCQQYVNAETGEVVKPIRAYQYGDKMVTLEPGEVPELDGTDAVQLTANLPADEVPAEWILGTNLCWPTDQTQDAGYMLVAHYLETHDRVFIGKLVDRGTTKVLAIRWSHAYGCMIAQTLAYHAQVRWQNVEAIKEGLATLPKPDPNMAKMAETLFDSIGDDFDWEEVEDEYGKALEAAIIQKATVGAVAKQVKAEAPAPPSDLFAALTASLAAPTKKKGKVKA